jgi:hypothetical protein
MLNFRRCFFLIKLIELEALSNNILETLTCLTSKQMYLGQNLQIVSSNIQIEYLKVKNISGLLPFIGVFSSKIAFSSSFCDLLYHLDCFDQVILQKVKKIKIFILLHNLNKNKTFILSKRLLNSKWP